MSGAALSPSVIANARAPQPPLDGLSLLETSIEWVSASDCDERLFGPIGLPWDEWQRGGRIEVVKSGPHRTVYRLSLPGGEFYIKHFRTADWKSRLRNLVRAAPAERELRAVQRLRALRFPTFDPVALGRSRAWGKTGDTWLITRAISDAMPLDQFMLTEFAACGPDRQAELRQRLAVELGVLAARLHSAGIEHIDLHAGNLLICPTATGEQPLLSLIDLHAVRFHSSLTRRRRDRNLAALHQFFSGRSTRSDRKRFWAAYQTQLKLMRKASKEAADDAARPSRNQERDRHPPSILCVFAPLRELIPDDKVTNLTQRRKDAKGNWGRVRYRKSARLAESRDVRSTAGRGLSATVVSAIFAFIRVIRGASFHNDNGAARLERRLQRAAQAGWQRADRAWRRGNRHVRRLDHGSVRCRGLATLDPSTLTTIRDNPESLFMCHLIRWCKQTPRRRVAEVRVTIGEGGVVERRGVEMTGVTGGSRASAGDSETHHNLPPSTPHPHWLTSSQWHPIESRDAGHANVGDGFRPVSAYWKCILESGSRRLSRWRFSPVRQAWDVGHALLRRRIDTPRPLLFVESGDRDRRHCYLLTEAIDNSLTVREFFDRDWPTLTNEQRTAWLRPRLRQLARQLRRLHDSGFDHRDLKFPNLLISADADDARVWLLDLDAVRRWPWLPRFRAVQNLARLNVSSLLVPGIRHVDRLRFLKWYLERTSKTDWKRWWRSITRISIRKIARNQRALRPLS